MDQECRRHRGWISEVNEELIIKTKQGMCKDLGGIRVWKIRGNMIDLGPNVVCFSFLLLLI